jgi:Predicted membrane protein
VTTLKEFEEALRAAGNTEALKILDRLRDRDRATRSIRPARRLTGRKMTPELAAEILHLHQTTDMTQQEIAFQLGINQGRVNEVIKRGKWLDGDPNAPEAISRDKAKERAREGVGFEPREAKASKSKKKAKAEAATAAPEEIVPEETPVAEPPVAEAPVIAPPAEAAAPEPLVPDAQAPESPPAESQSAEPPATEPKAEKKKKPGKKKPSQQLLFDGI